jgi:hypothetical protein
MLPHVSALGFVWAGVGRFNEARETVARQKLITPAVEALIRTPSIANYGWPVSVSRPKIFYNAKHTAHTA